MKCNVQKVVLSFLIIPTNHFEEIFNENFAELGNIRQKVVQEYRLLQNPTVVNTMQW